MIGRTKLVLFAGAISIAALAYAPLRSGDLVLYNHSPSLPIGFYVRTGSPIRRASIVTVRASDVAPADAHARHFVGPRDRFIKRVAARGGDLVCAHDGAVTINNALAAEHFENDSSDRPLQHWSECRVLQADEYFLLGDTSDSFDSRYWGPVNASQIEGVWRKL